MLIHGEPNRCLRLGRLVFDSVSVGFFSTCLARSLAFLRSLGLSEVFKSLLKVF